MLGPLARTGPDQHSDGLHATVLENGAVTRVVAILQGKVRAQLRIVAGQARARYEDSANVETFDEGRTEAYGGRYEHEGESGDFRSWIKEKLRRMESDWLSHLRP
jgi:hypothetical protein